MSNSNEGDGTTQFETSVIPYLRWIEDAYHTVVIHALEYVAAEGMPEGHCFYLSLNTKYPGLFMPSYLKVQYPEEIVIVLENCFWDLNVDRKKRTVSVGLSFNNNSTTFVFPFGAIRSFSDPFVHLGFQFHAQKDEYKVAEKRAVEIPPSPCHSTQDVAEIVQLSNFRKPPPKPLS